MRYRTANQNELSAPPQRALTGVIVLLVVAGGLPSCGGGSVGTGTGENLTTIEGRILSTEGRPIAGATVDVGSAAAPGTTSTSSTDPNGHFVIAVPSSDVPSTIQLQVSAPAQDTATLPVDATPVDPAAIVVQVVVDDVAPPVAIQSTDLSVQIIGACASAFENNRDIVQIAPIDSGTICTASVTAKEDGLPRAEARFRLEVRACDENAEWTEIGSGVTVSDGTTALGLVDFPFIQDEGHCVYRILAPVDEPDVERTAFDIKTLLKQDFDNPPATPVETPSPEPSPEPTEAPSPEATPTPPDSQPSPVESPTPSPSPAASPDLGAPV